MIHLKKINLAIIHYATQVKSAYWKLKMRYRISQFSVICVTCIYVAIFTAIIFFTSFQRWNAPTLMWVPADHGNVTSLHLPPERVWTPDLVVQTR
jgi:hypothetical protein